MQRDEIIINSRFASYAISEVPLNPEEQSIPLFRKMTLNTNTLLERLAQNLASNFGLSIIPAVLPQGCRFIKKFPSGRSLIVIEEPPMMRTLFTNISLEADLIRLEKLGKLDEFGYRDLLNEFDKGNIRQPYKFIVSLPYIVYLIMIDSPKYFRGLRVFYRKNPISSLNDYLLRCNLLNIDSDNGVCLGDGDTSGKNMSETVSNTITAFWSTIFNYGLTGSFRYYEGKIPEVSDFLSWQYYSLKDPLFVFSIDWIPIERTLGQEIEGLNARDSYSSRSSRVSFSFDVLKNAAVGPYLNSEEEQVESCCESVIIDERVFSIGDEIILDDHIYSIVDFRVSRGALNYRSPETVVLENENGTIEKRIRDKSVVEAFKKTKFNNEIDSYTLQNGVEIRAGDILQLTNPLAKNYFRKVIKIRNARDEHIEVQLGRDFYFADKLVASKLTNILVLDNVELTKGKDYTLCTNSTGVFLKANKYVFSGFDTNDEGSLYVKFGIPNRSNDAIYTSTEEFNHSYSLLESSTLVSYPVFRIFNKIFSNSDSGLFISKGKGVISIGRGDVEFKFDSKLAASLVTNEGFNIPSFDIDLDFRLGDKVIVVDWSNPFDMLVIRTITEFKIERNALLIGLKDDVGNTMYHKYIDFRNGEILIGTMRKVVEEYNGLKRGMKLKAQLSGVYGFPKKDINEICAFITDTGTGTPLMLCSNLQTLWAAPEVLRHFNYMLPNSSLSHKYPIKSRNEISLHFPVMSGDVISRSNYDYMAVYDHKYGDPQELYIMDLMYGVHYSHLGRDISHTQRKGVLTPRYRASSLGFVMRRGFPNLHGGFTLSQNAGPKFISDWRFSCSEFT